MQAFGTFPDPHQAPRRARCLERGRKKETRVSGSRKTRLNRCTLVTDEPPRAHQTLGSTSGSPPSLPCAFARAVHVARAGACPPQAGGPPYVFSARQVCCSTRCANLSYPAAISCIVCRASASLIVSAWARISWARTRQRLTSNTSSASGVTWRSPPSVVPLEPPHVERMREALNGLATSRSRARRAPPPLTAHYLY